MPPNRPTAQPSPESTKTTRTTQAGSGWTWCENTGESLQLGSSGPITTSLDLTTTSCDLSQIHQLNLYVSTDTYIDNIWAR